MSSVCPINTIICCWNSFVVANVFSVKQHMCHICLWQCNPRPEKSDRWCCDIVLLIEFSATFDHSMCKTLNENGMNDTYPRAKCRMVWMTLTREPTPVDDSTLIQLRCPAPLPSGVHGHYRANCGRAEALWERDGAGCPRRLKLIDLSHGALSPCSLIDFTLATEASHAVKDRTAEGKGKEHAW